MRFRKLPRLRSILALFVLLGLLVVSLVLYAHSLLQKPSVQKTLVARISRITGYRIETGPIELSLWKGVGVVAHAFLAVSPEGGGRIQADALRIRLSAGPLLRGRLVPVELALERPRIVVDLPEEGSAATWSQALPIPWIQGLSTLSIEEGSVVVRNRPYDLEALQIRARAVEGDPSRFDLMSSGRLVHGEERIPFRARGSLSPPASEKEPEPFRFHVEVGRVPATWIPWPEDLPFRGGGVEASFTVEGVTGRPLSVDGSAFLKDLDFLLLDEGRSKAYTPPDIEISFRGTVEPSRIRMPRVTLRTEDLSLRLHVEVELPENETPRLKMRVESEPMSFALLARYFPTPLLPSWLEDRLFPLLQEGVVRLEHLTIRGSLDEIENLDQPAHAGALSMAVACEDFRVSGRGIPTPFQDVSARVTYAEGALHITDLQGRLDGSTVRECRIDIQDLLEDRPLWSILVDGDFHLSTLMKQREIDFLPPDVLQQLNRIGPLTGDLSCRAWFRYEPEWDFPRTREGAFVLRDCVVRQPELGLPITISNAQIHLAELSESRFQASGAWGSSRFEAGGVLGDRSRSFALESADVSAWMDMNEALPVLLKGFELPLSFEAPVSTHVTLARDKDRWACRGRVELKGVTLRNDHVSMNPPGEDDHIAFDLHVGPGGDLALNEVRCRLRGSVVDLSGGYHLDRKDLFTAEIASNGLDLADLGLRFRDHGRPTRGFLQGRLKVLSSRRDPYATMILGRIEARDVSARLHRLPSEITEASFTLDFSGKTVSVGSCRMRVGGSKVDVEGEIQGWRGLQGQLRIGAQFLNPEDFLHLEGGKDTPFQGPPENMNLRLEIHGDNAQWRGMPFGPLRAEVHLRDGEVHLIRSRVRLHHGVLTSSGHLRSAPAPQVYLSNHVRLTEQPVPELLDNLKVETRFLKGHLNMEAYLTLQGASLDGLLPSLSGNVNVVIRDGVIGKSSVFARILDLLSLQKAFTRKPGDVPEGGFYFEEMKGFGVIDRGILATDDFTMTSPAYNAVAAGRADLTEKTVDFTLGVQPLETLDVLVSRIPILGYALTGKDRSFLVYYFEVAGLMGDPTTRHVPLQHLGGGVAGVLKRLFLSPLRLYDQISGSTAPPSPPASSKTPGP